MLVWLVMCCQEEIPLSSAARSEVRVSNWSAPLELPGIQCLVLWPVELPSLQLLDLPSALQTNNRIQMESPKLKASNNVLVGSFECPKHHFWWQNRDIHSHYLLHFSFLCATKHNTMNALKERLSESARHYPHMFDSSCLIPLYDCRLFTRPRVAIYNSFKHFYM